MKNILGVYCKEYPKKILLQEKDMDSVEKISDILKNGTHVYFTKEGIESIANHFSPSQLSMFSFSLKTADDLLACYMKSMISNPDDVAIWNKDDLLRNMTGMDGLKITNDFVVIYMDDPLPLQAEDLKRYLLMIKEKYDSKGFNKRLFDFVWKRHLPETKSYRYFFEDGDCLDDLDIQYTTDDILNHFVRCIDSMDENEGMDRILSRTLEEIELYIQEEGKPLHERELPLYAMVKIVSNLDRSDSKANPERKKIYITLLDRLCERKNVYGLETKAYACYCGNHYIMQDFKASEQCLLALLENHYSDDYCNTLGYIYYYGRVNNGIPEYEKALSYFTMAAICGNIEATYKLGDMYKNGYGVKKNKDVASSCYHNLYWKTRADFLRNSHGSNFCDVALRLAPIYASTNPLLEIRFYLEALMAIQIRNGLFDSGVKRTLVKNIDEWYSKHENDIHDDESNFINAMTDYGEFDIERKGNELLLTSDEKRIATDIWQKNCICTDCLKVKFEGVVQLDIHEKTPCDCVTYDFKKKCYSFSFDSEEILVIKAERMEIEFDYPLIEENDDPTLYHVAQCQYTKNQGKIYTFLVLDEGTLEDSWVIDEDGKDIYPIRFCYMTDKELPCDLSIMKHIRRK